MKRVFLSGYYASPDVPDLRTALDIYFTSADGEKQVWTPDWKKETAQLFTEASRLHELIRKQGLPAPQRGEPAAPLAEDEKTEGSSEEWEILSLKAGEALRLRTSLPRIKKVASRLFEFDVTWHTSARITDRTIQEIYNWLMTLGQQPYTRIKKIVLARKFVAALAPKHHPLKSAVRQKKVVLRSVL